MNEPDPNKRLDLGEIDVKPSNKNEFLYNFKCCGPIGIYDIAVGKTMMKFSVIYKLLAANFEISIQTSFLENSCKKLFSLVDLVPYEFTL